MKISSNSKNPFVLPTLIAGFSLILAGRMTAQTFTTLHSFTTPSSLPPYGNSDGANPIASLILSGNILYGTAYFGGSSGDGAVFRMKTDGTGFTNLYSFTPLSNPYSGTNSDGANPNRLILSGNILYGTASGGGSSGDGAVFSVSTDGTGFTNLYSFTTVSGIFPSITNSDGANPNSGLILSGNTLYGTARIGGSSGCGTVFSLSLPLPQLTIAPYGANLVLKWPTNAGFTLQSTTNLFSPVAWTAVSPGPVVVNGQNAVTNPISGTQQFFRLSQ